MRPRAHDVPSRLVHRPEEGVTEALVGVDRPGREAVPRRGSVEIPLDHGHQGRGRCGVRGDFQIVLIRAGQAGPVVVLQPGPHARGVGE